MSTSTAYGLCLLIALGSLHCAIPSSSAFSNGEDDVGEARSEVGETIARPDGSRAAVLSVDCALADAEVENQVRYARGWVQPIDVRDSDVAANVRTASAMRPTMATAIFDLNADPNAGMFQLDAATGSLAPNANDAGFVTQLAAVKTAGVPTFVQLSGTPRAAPATWLDDQDYVSRESASGNFYPLPRAANVASVQRAIIDAILATEKKPGLGGNVWIGTQEPTHTIGFSPVATDGSTACAAPRGASPEEKLECRKNNIRRFIAYWRPIAKALRRNSIKVGGIQLNSHDRDLYVFAADELIATQTPIDTFTIQRYSSFDDIVPRAHEAYERFQRAPGYENVKIAFTRYSFDNNQTADSRLDYFTSAAGMVQLLADEHEIMSHAAMMEGYAYQTSGILEPTSLAPTVMAWLQTAPAPLRATTVTNAAPGIDAIALVRTGNAPHASVAVWNRGAATQDVALVLARSKVDFGTKRLRAVKGSGTTITSTPVTLREGRITGLTLAPNELALIDAE